MHSSRLVKPFSTSLTLLLEQSATYFRRCLNLIFFISVLSAIATPAQAQPLPERQPLITIANNGLFYFLYSALEEPSFATELKPKEKEMAQHLSDILELAQRLKWYKENNIPHFDKTRQGHPIYAFAYVDHNEKVIQSDVPMKNAPAILFSNDRSRFVGLQPGEGERAAMTRPIFDAPIEINLHRLNSVTDTTFDLGTAAALLIHEYGHKLGPLKDQAAVDGLAAKLGDFIRGRINTHPLANGTTVYSLYFNNFQYKKWMNFSKSPFPEIPGKILLTGFASEPALSHGDRALPIFANQGLYVWSDHSHQISDLTSSVLSKLRKKNLLSWNTENAELYKFVNHTMYSINSFQVTEPSPGEPDFKATYTQVEIVLPYMIPNVSKDPKQIEFHKRFFWSGGRYIFQPHSMTLSYNYNGPHFQFKSLEERSVVQIDIPHFNTELVSSKFQNDGLILKIKVLGPKLLGTNEGTGYVILLQGEIAIKTAQGTVLIKSSEYDRNSEIYTFKIDKTYAIAQKELVIEQMFLRSQDPQITQDSFYAKAEIPLFKPITIPLDQAHYKANVLPPAQALKLKSIHSPQETGSRLLKFVYDSNEYVRSMNLSLRFKRSSFAKIEATYETEKLIRKQTDNSTYEYTADLTLNARDMRQSLKNGQLTVSIDISRFGTLASEALLESGEKVKFTKVDIVHPEIEIRQVLTTMDSLAQNDTKLPTPHRFTITSSNPEAITWGELLNAPNFENKIYKMCRSLF